MDASYFREVRSCCFEWFLVAKESIKSFLKKEKTTGTIILLVLVHLLRGKSNFGAF